MQNTIIPTDTNHQPIPVVDVFAGPGGLGEGFSSVTEPVNARTRRFSIALSIEKDPCAYQTLLLRTFLKQFPVGDFPPEYYTFMAGGIEDVQKLFDMYPDQIQTARQQAWQAILGYDKNVKGVDSLEIDARIRAAVDGSDKWVLIGGPPCQAYSIVGRARNKGIINPKDPRVYLYREYYRILAVHSPAVFVMENVKGLLSSKVDKEHIFPQIIHDLENPAAAFGLLNGSKSEIDHPGYSLFSIVRPPRTDSDLFGGGACEQKDFLIESEKYGVPQKRHRLILLGVRNDLVKGINVGLLQPYAGKLPTVRSVIGDLPALRSQLSGRGGEPSDSNNSWLRNLTSSLAKNDIWKGTDTATLKLISKTIGRMKIPVHNTGRTYINVSSVPIHNPDGWYTDPKFEGICHHETRAHIGRDVLRYLFASCYTEVHGRFPLLPDYPDGLLPAHRNVGEAIKHGKFSDRFCVQVWDSPSRTITSHISKDGHYYIHPDPGQSRSMTVREAARLQTFPDNYYFCGPRTAQFHQVGNAVPPYLAYQIASIVSDLFNQIESLNPTVEHEEKRNTAREKLTIGIS